MAELGRVPFYNQVMDKTSMRQLIGRLVAHLGSRHTAHVLDQLKTLGFKYATQAGISLGIDDLVTTPSKAWLIQDAEQQAHLSEKLQQCGSIHAVEKLRQLVETWYTTSEYLKREMTPNFRMTNPLNPVHLMSFSGARGSVSQVHQLVGMRGLMSDPQGQIIDLPIQSNFREGLSLTEYIISCYGARKGVVDTAVRTADAGYLTRRLVEVVQHVVVRKVDCGTLEGVILGSIQDHKGKPCVSWEQRVVGRVLASPVYVDGQLMAPRNQEIGIELAHRLAISEATGVQIRSPMTCQGVQWVCQLCYGWSLSHGRMVAIGEAIGIMAGQSIGEPGTQLTLRTFHTGGVFTGDIAEHVRAPLNGIVHFDPGLVQPTRTRHGRPAFICQRALRVIIQGKDRDHALRVPPQSLLLVNPDEYVEAKQVIAEVRAATAPFKERVQKHIYSDLPGEMHWGKAVCHAPRRTRLSFLLATGHLWVLSGQLCRLPKRGFLFYQNSDHIERRQPIGDQALSHFVCRAKDSHLTKLPHGRGKQAEWDLARNHWFLRLNAFLGTVQRVIPSLLQYSLSVKEINQSKVTYQLLATFNEPRYRTESGGIIKYGTVQTEPFISFPNLLMGSVNTAVLDSFPKTPLGLRSALSSFGQPSSNTSRARSKQNQEETTLFRVIQGGSLFWIPEEIYLLAPSLSPYFQDGDMIRANTEIASGVFSKSGGLVQIRYTKEHSFEVTLLPGIIYSFSNLPFQVSRHNTLLPPGELAIDELCLKTWSFLQLLPSDKGEKQWLIRPALQYQVDHIPSKLVKNHFQAEKTEVANKEWAYCLPYADGQHLSSQHGVQLLQTCLLLGPIPQPSLQCNAQNYTFKERECGYYTQRDYVEDGLNKATSSLDEPKKKAFVASLSGGTLHSLTGTEPRPEILVLSRSDLLRAPFTFSCSKSLLTDPPSTPCWTPGLIGRACLPIWSRRNIPSDTLTSPKPSWLVINEQATVKSLIAFTSVKALESKKRGWARLAQLVCEGITLKSEFTYPESGQIIAVDGQSAVLRLARPTLVTAKAAVHSCHAGPVKEGDPLITLVYERLRSGDIIQGLPKVEQLLEARSIHARGFHLDRPDSDWKRELSFALEDSCMQASRTNFEIRHLQLSLIDEVQRVYQSQGVLISDKHVEIIVRQMSSKALIEDVSTNQSHSFEPHLAKARFNWLRSASAYDCVLPGQFVGINRTHNMAYLPALPIPYRPLLLGITRTSFHTDSVLSEASFQQTVKALSVGALQGRIDWLRGLKERVMVGGLIPAGTGCEEVAWQNEALGTRFCSDLSPRSQVRFLHKKDQALCRCARIIPMSHKAQNKKVMT